ncbi:MAG: aminotransferase class I/II-fold pyridoxal phosphate-dependent enzyme [Acidobacteriota bacterium]|nr:aminotransferase class I/II-fold pyridoxal phosphate-dependent enzyme [Acidobacteriota bacterium]
MGENDSQARASATGQRRYPLEPSGDEIRRLLAVVGESIAEHLDSLGEQPSVDLEGSAELAESVREGWPPEVEPLEQILHRLFHRLAPKSFNTAGPGFLAYVPGGGLFFTALADLIADSINRYTTVWSAAPGLVQLEINVIRWFCAMVGYPATAGGFLSSGGSIASLSAVVAARHKHLPENFLRGTAYGSDQTHHCIHKALRLAGFPPQNFRSIPVDDEQRIRLDALEEQLAADRAEGYQPFLLVGNAGTTNTGAVDPLPRLAEIARHHGLWLHADAAYGGFFALTDRGRRALAGLERADSITLDPHKGLFLPYGTGCLLVRDLGALHRSHAASADYMPALQEDPNRIDFSAVSPELSREFRGLRVWLPMKLLGVEPFRTALDEKLDLAHWTCGELARIEGIRIAAPPQLSLLAFRLILAGAEGEPLAEDLLDAANRELLDRINRRGRVMLTGTRLHGRFVLRICILSFRTHQRNLEHLIEDLRAEVAELRLEAREG